MVIMNDSKLKYLLLLIVLIGYSLYGCGNELSDDRKSLISYSEESLGVSYSSDYKRGFDCSGYVQHCYKQLAVKVPRSSKKQFAQGKTIDLEDALVGDVIVFTGSNAKKREAGHVGIIHHMNGDTVFFIHSSTTQGVIINHNREPYYSDRYLGVVKYIED